MITAENTFDCYVCKSKFCDNRTAICVFCRYSDAIKDATFINNQNTRIQELERQLKLSVNYKSIIRQALDAEDASMGTPLDRLSSLLEILENIIL